jgi:hypothetical protein
MHLLLAASLALMAQSELPQWQMISLTVREGIADSLVFADKASLKREGTTAQATIFFVGEKNATRMLYEFDCAGNRSHALSMHIPDAGKDVPVGSMGEWTSIAGRTGGPAYDMQRYACEGVRSDAPVMQLATPVNMARAYLASLKAKSPQK